MHCDDPGDEHGGSCKKTSHPVAYEVEKNDKKLKNELPIISFCDGFFNSDTTAVKINHIYVHWETFPTDDV